MSSENTEPAGTISTDRPTLSHTGLNMFTRCPMQYRYRYLDGIIAPPGVAMIVGKGVDKAVSADLGSVIETGELLPEEAVKETARDATELAWEMEEIALNEEETVIGRDMVKGESVDKAVRLSVLHHGEIAPTLEPVAVQHPWRVEVPDLGYDLIGFIDVLEGEAGSRTVRDTKTSKKKPPADDADRDLQLTTYALAMFVHDGQLPVLLTKDYLVDTKKLEPVVLETTRTNDDLVAMLERVRIVAEAIEKGAFTPTDPKNWWCSKKWCGYWSRCPWGAAQRVTVGT